MTREEKFEKQAKEVLNLHLMLIKEDIIPEVLLTFDLSEKSYFEVIQNGLVSININLMETEFFAEKYDESFLHLKTYLHEAGHAFHYFEFASDYDLKDKVYYEVYDLILKHIPHEYMQKVYENMPIEKEANALAELMWEQLQDNLHLILED